MDNQKLTDAKKAKNDEFFTQLADIQREVNAYIEYNPDVFKDKTILLPCDDPEFSNFTRFFAQNFERFGIKKLISTSYAYASKRITTPYQLSLFESQSPKFDKNKTKKHGKIFTLTRDKNKSGNIDINDLEWNYLKGDGDFRSEEVKKLRDEADIIITNPPFSLFREFVSWIFENEKEKKFLIIGNKNSVTYKEIFPLIKENKIWIGYRNINEDMWLEVPDFYDCEKSVDGKRLKHIMACWFSNLEHGGRYQPLSLMTMADNLKFSKHKEIKGNGYQKYDNYDAIEVPFTDAIPSDYNGVMGVPISFLGKYNPEQFEIIGASDNGAVGEEYKLPHFKKHNEPYINGEKQYKRIFIKFKRN